jgi:nucleoside-diphosphate-sugar epimerase
MRIVVVGGSGNISTPVVALLVRDGHDVTVVTRGRRPVPDGVRTIVGDRGDRAWFETTMRQADFEVAIDMMAFTRDDAESSLRAFAGVERFIQTSTILVYGDSRHFLLSTEDEPLASTAPYGGQKAEIDALYLEAHARDGFPVTILRPSFAFGGPGFPLLRQVGASDDWVDRIRAGRPLVVCGDGTALVRFLHVEDAALAYVGALAHPETIGRAYNLVDPRIITWADYHRAAMRAVGRDVELVGVSFADLQALAVPGFGACETVNGYHWIHDDARIRRDIPEFRPRLPLTDALASAVELAEREGRIPADGGGDDDGWEDRVIAAQRRVRA